MELFSCLLAQLQTGRRAVLCRIVRSSGSTPRGPGARMALLEDGESIGTIGGGAAEQEALGRAGRLWEEEQDWALETYALTPEAAGSVGMICGGEVTVLFQRLSGEHIPLLHTITAAMAEGGRAWLVSGRTAGGRWETAVYRGRGSCLSFSEERLRPLLGRRGGMDGDCCAEPLTRPGMVYLFGAGHVGQALVPLLTAADFRVTVVDDRPQLAQPSRFPTADAVLLRPYAPLPAALGPEDYAVIMTPGHLGDYTVLEQALRTPCGYIGCIGSRRKIAAARERLKAAGFAEDQLGRIYAPIGLPIGAETPAEVAISVAAELIAHRAVGEGNAKAAPALLHMGLGR